MQEKTINDDLLKSELSKRSLSFIRSNGVEKNCITVDASKLHPVKVDKKDTLYVPIPLSVQIMLDKNNEISKVEASEISAEKLTDAEHFVKTLVDNNKIGGLKNSVNNATHEIKVDQDGRKVIMRRGFSAF